MGPRALSRTPTTNGPLSVVYSSIPSVRAGLAIDRSQSEEHRLECELSVGVLFECLDGITHQRELAKDGGRRERRRGVPDCIDQVGVPRLRGDAQHGAEDVPVP